MTRRLTTPTPSWRDPPGGRVNFTELLTDLQTRHDAATTRAGATRRLDLDLTARTVPGPPIPKGEPATASDIGEQEPAG